MQYGTRKVRTEDKFNQIICVLYKSNVKLSTSHNTQYVCVLPRVSIYKIYYVYFILFKGNYINYPRIIYLF